MAVDDLNIVTRESDFDTSDNPATAENLRDPQTSATGLEAARSDLEIALNGLQEGNVTAEAAADTLVRLMDARDAAAREEQVIFMRGGLQLESAMLSVFAHLTEAPCNWHQAVTFFLCSQAEEDAVLRQKAPRMFVAGCLMVFMQIAAAASVWSGSYKPSCVDHAQCQVTNGARCQMYGGSVEISVPVYSYRVVHVDFQYDENSVL
jgi:hypothetical protein